MKPLGRLVLAAALALAPTAGLVGCGGGGAQVQSHTITNTLGKELMDLDQARKQGVISESEYDRLRQQIMNKYK